MYTTATKELFIKTLKTSYCHIGEACEAAGISRQTYYDWMTTVPDFKAAVLAMREVQLDRAEAVLNESIDKDKNLDSVKFLLKTIGRLRGYQEKSEVDITTNGESINKITVEIVHKNLTDGKETN
jgi:ACT domain-containing protein